MKKFIPLLLTLVMSTQTALSLQVSTDDWLNTDSEAEVSALELDLKSDLKNDFRFYQVLLVNKSDETVDVTVDPNKKSSDFVNNLIKENITVKELMQVPKQIAVESYKEDVGTGKIAKAHKGLIYVSTTAGVAATGAGFLGIYPQQKIEEYFSHKKIKKEYKKITEKVLERFTLSPLEQIDFLMLVPLDDPTPYINIQKRQPEDEVNPELHQI